MTARASANTLQSNRRPAPGGELADPCLVVINGPRLGQCIHVDPVPVILGRDALADFHLPDRSVSRAHCTVWRDGRQVRVRDLHSKNGTTVNGQAVGQATLHEGDQLALGDVVLKFVSGRLEARYHEALFGLATLDTLTQLLNRRQFRALLDESVERLEDGRALVLAIIDVDDFKRVNDERGHDAGDEVLRTIAAVLRGHLGPGDIAGRLGGDEFVAMLHLSGIGQGLAWAEALRQDLAERPDAATVSIGLASWHGSGGSPSEMLHAADMHLLAAKQGGRNRVAA